MKTNEKLKNDVLAELKYEPSIDANQIGVITKNGIATLTGHVTSYSQKMAAERAARRVNGVRAVAEEIEVNYPSNNKKTDPEIAEAVANAFKWNSSIPEKEVKIKVENNNVYLDGKVDWDFQRRSAKNTAGELTGVKHVYDRIELKTPINSSKVKSEIRDALERTARIEANNISVTAKGHVVTLKGKVDSWADLREAKRSALRAPGVWSVENELEVV
ncbi:MAG: osmotically-inducible protein OsmY [Parvicellaceae bacterium]|jgi:osmotically-inducible protein OsmY